jgi:regulator of cell morphogenesis and NO signaling
LRTGAELGLWASILQRHEGLRERLRRVAALLEEIVEAHGDQRPDLRTLGRAFGHLRAELELHLQGEDELLFPACARLGLQTGGRIDDMLLTAQAREHASVADGLVALRLLADDYDARRAVCGAHRTVLDELAAFELELRRQLHDEDNLLIPQT